MNQTMIWRDILVERTNNKKTILQQASVYKFKEKVYSQLFILYINTHEKEGIDTYPFSIYQSEEMISS